MRLARLQQAYAKIEQAADGGLVLRVVVPVNTDDSLNPLKLLQVIEPVPRSLAQDAERVQAGVRDYQELSFSRGALKRLYALTLTLTLLLALTSALGLAVVLSERFAAPLGLLAEGTRAVAQGDFTRRQPVVIARRARRAHRVVQHDDRAARRGAREARGVSRRAIETTRAYLESILGNLSAGVLVFDDTLSAAHGESERGGDPAAAAGGSHRHGARAIGASACPRSRRSPSSSPKAFAAAATGSGRRKPRSTVANLSRTLLMRGTRLPGAADAGGYVVVFDDVSELVQAQRDAAWAEVARRLAHEIKNPLTPIQLSAERLAVKLDGKLDGADAETLRRGTQTIVSQVAR